MKKFLLIIVSLIFITNLPPLNLITGPDDILYSNGNGTFTFAEVNTKGRNYDLCIRIFEAFKSAHNNDTILYRITPMYPFKFWRWGAYLTKKKYKLQYMSWKDIDAVRGKIRNKSTWQDF
ncbi:hypothetical protein [Longitalea luteola]|uniref:hypothetical protein n=1 Tax=Longitalea luteola TaxID=2812563 RepID=UPI001A957572|nr:hypothetical protein [Longitalea luteola]